MKTLYLVRHAKSSWDFPQLDDFERPLNQRGKKDAPRMGKFLANEGVKPDLLLSSPAKRALKTARKIAKELGYEKEDIHTDRALYHAWPDRLLKAVVDLSDQHSAVMVFGHNPGLTEFCNELCGASIDNIPTAGVAAIDFSVDHWRDVGYGSGKLKFFQNPKGLPEGV